MKSKNSLKTKLVFLMFSMMLTACTSQSERAHYYTEHRNEMQLVARECIQKSKTGENIEKDANCMGLIQAEQDWCRARQAEHALYYLQHDCNNKPQMLWMTYEGF